MDGSAAAERPRRSRDDAQAKLLRQRERDVLRLAIELAHARRAPLAQAREHFAHEAFGCRGAGGDADLAARLRSIRGGCRRRRRSGTPARPASRRARAGGSSSSCSASRPPARDRTAGRACARRPGGSASRSRCRRGAGPRIAGKALAQRLDDGLGVVDRKRRLRDVGELCRIARRQAADAVRRLDEMDRAGVRSRPTDPSCLRLRDGRRGRSAPRRARPCRGARLPCAPSSPAGTSHRTREGRACRPRCARSAKRRVR